MADMDRKEMESAVESHPVCLRGAGADGSDLRGTGN